MIAASVAPPIVMIVFLSIGLIDTLEKWGKVKNENQKRRYDWIDLAGVALTAGILYWGGFFAPLGGP